MDVSNKHRDQIQNLNLKLHEFRSKLSRLHKKGEKKCQINSSAQMMLLFLPKLLKANVWLTNFTYLKKMQITKTKDNNCLTALSHNAKKAKLQ